MSEFKIGKIVKGLGGLYITRVAENDGKALYTTRAKGILKRDEEKLLVGDTVRLLIDEAVEGGAVISELLPRSNELIRPPLSNLDYLFIVFSARKPQPQLETVDKLIAIAEHNGITPVAVITKADTDPSYASELSEIYKKAGFDTFLTSSKTGEGKDELSEYIKNNVKDGRTAAFAGASGVGKSTLMNALFPSLTLATAEISRKIERGKHTTRHVEIFDISDSADTGFLADTPGFSLLDFERFDFFDSEELFPTFRDFASYSGKCKYADCSHVGESKEECALALAAEEGKISKSRLESYRSIWRTLKAKKKYD